jgi:hypothetical protein
MPCYRARVSVFWECRLFDAAKFESLRLDLEALIRGEVRASVRAAALEGLKQLEGTSAYGEEVLRDYWAEPLRVIANATRDFPNRSTVPSINALLTTVCMVGYERISFDATAPAPRNLVELASGRDGHLFAELATRSRWIDDLFHGMASPWWPSDLPQPEPPDYEWCQHRAVLVLSRADLERFEGELARMATDPRWLKDLSWDRVMPEHAAPAFALLSDLVARALQDPALTLVVEVNG